MSTYKKEVGTAVQNNAGDYTGAVEGQLWYNSTAGSFQFRSVTTVGAWATGGDLNSGRRYQPGAGESNSSAITMGGAGAGSPADSALTESYNGTSWTEVNDLNLARQTLAGSGTQTSALAYSGSTTPGDVNKTETESYNGTCWTEVGDVNTARRGLGGVGADNTSALAFAGFSTVYVANTESYNGTSWTEVNDLNTARNNLGSIGVQPSALCVGGNPGSPPFSTGATENWNGTCWAEVNDLNTARFGAGGAGTTTSGLAFGGSAPPKITNTESWNGTCWAETTDLSSARNTMGANGTATSALAAGGDAPTNPFAGTEEWTGPGAPTTETITTS